MSDPAIEAADRSLADKPAWDIEAYDWERVAITAAREALAPIRDLHQPARDGAWTVCFHCSLGASFVPWPCATAVLVYTTDELETR